MSAIAIAILAFAVFASATVVVVRRLDSLRAERIIERRLQILARSEL
jgi:hypothetical protein